MARTTIPWGDGSGDNIYLDYNAASGNQTVTVSSDANGGASSRSKVITFATTSGSPAVTQTLTVVQAAQSTDLIIITRNDVAISHGETALGYHDDGSIIYSLSDHTCDGTAATAINTGLYLFDTTAYPNGWQIDFDFTVNSGNGSNASYLRCRNAESPYLGFTLRRLANNAARMECQIDSSVKNNISAGAGTRCHFLITNNLTNTWLEQNGSTLLSAPTPTSVIAPLVIGGELSSDTTQEWNTERFGKIYIHSLIITPL